jgi:hypothetical protein
VFGKAVQCASQLKMHQNDGFFLSQHIKTIEKHLKNINLMLFSGKTLFEK